MFSKPDIEKYFIAEKQESLLFMGFGIAAVLIALVFLFYLKTGFYRGASIPLLLVGILLGVVGYSVYARSDRQRIDNVYAYDMNPSVLKNEELPRMKTVMKNFILYRYTEIGLALLGIFFFIYFRKADMGGESWSGPSFWKGFGISLALMALLALGADYFAEKRGKKYTKGLESFIPVREK